jgi:hypothetical protein
LVSISCAMNCAFALLPRGVIANSTPGALVAVHPCGTRMAMPCARS